MPNTVTPEMVRLLNSGDQRELRAFLMLYAKPVYDRAFDITCDEIDAKRVTRRVITETALLAAKGALNEDVDAQLMALTDACCSEDLFFARLVDDTMKELVSHPVREPDRLPVQERVAPRAVPAQKNAAPADKPSACAPAAANFAQKAAEPIRPAQETAEPAQPFQKTAASAPQSAAKPARQSVPTPPAYANPAHETQREVYAADPAAEAAVPDLFMEEDGPELDEADGKKAGPLIVVLIFTLSLLTIALVWVLLVKLMYLGVIPKFDFGFADWFNHHLFLLY